MKSELILTSSEVEDLAVCVDCAFQECMDCPRNKAKQKLKEAVIDKGDVSNGIAPIADAVPVVRCRECKHLGFCGDATNLEVMGFYGYCSRGERKEGTNNGIHK